MTTIRALGRRLLVELPQPFVEVVNDGARKPRTLTGTVVGNHQAASVPLGSTVIFSEAGSTSLRVLDDHLVIVDVDAVSAVVEPDGAIQVADLSNSLERMRRNLGTTPIPSRSD